MAALGVLLEKHIPNDVTFLFSISILSFLLFFFFSKIKSTSRRMEKVALISCFMLLYVGKAK